MAHSVMKEGLEKRNEERQMELILIILLPIPRTGFLGGKIMPHDQKTQTEDNDLIFKASRTEIKEEIKRTIAFSQEHEQEIVDFGEAQIKSRIRSD